MSKETESFEEDRPAEMKLQHEYGILLSYLGSCSMNWEIDIPDCYKSKDGKWHYDWQIAVLRAEVRQLPASKEKREEPQTGLLALFDLQKETVHISNYYCTRQEYTLLCGFAVLFGLEPKVWKFEDIPIDAWGDMFQ